MGQEWERKKALQWYSQILPEEELSGKIIIANYTTSNQASKNGKVPTIVVGNVEQALYWNIEVFEEI